MIKILFFPTLNYDYYTLIWMKKCSLESWINHTDILDIMNFGIWESMGQEENFRGYILVN